MLIPKQTEVKGARKGRDMVRRMGGRGGMCHKGYYKKSPLLGTFILLYNNVGEEKITLR